MITHKWKHEYYIPFLHLNHTYWTFKFHHVTCLRLVCHSWPAHPLSVLQSRVLESRAWPVREESNMHEITEACEQICISRFEWSLTLMNFNGSFASAGDGHMPDFAHVWLNPYTACAAASSGFSPLLCQTWPDNNTEVTLPAHHFCWEHQRSSTRKADLDAHAGGKAKPVSSA